MNIILFLVQELFWTVKYFTCIHDNFENFRWSYFSLVYKVKSKMNLFALSFLFIPKWSTGRGFSYQLQGTDKPSFKKAITVERTCKKVEKCKADINFLVKCWDKVICTLLLLKSNV